MRTWWAELVKSVMARDGQLKLILPVNNMNTQ